MPTDLVDEFADLALGMAPMKPSTGWPSLKAMTAGIDWMPSWPAIEGWSSMFILTSLTLPPAAFTTFSMTGVSCLQGPHQGAQKSTSTGWRRDSWMTSAAKVGGRRFLDHSPGRRARRRIAKRDFRRRRRGSTILHGCGVLAAIAAKGAAKRICCRSSL
jgi:hypothetical protein